MWQFGYARGVNSTTKSPDRTRIAALAGLSLAVLLSTFNTSIVNVALPTLSRVFGASTQAVQWTVISFVLAITTLIVSVGRLADIVGRKRLLLSGVALFTVAAGACAFASSLGWLIGFRFFQGIGAAAMMALSVALIGELAPTEKAGRVMGLLGSMSAIGTALGPALGGLLIAAFGWRAIFLASVPLGAATWILLVRSLPADRFARAARRDDFDAWGTLLLAASLAAYALALTRQRSGFGAANFALLALAAVGAALFVRTQRRSTSPWLTMELLRDGALRGGLTMSLLVGAVMMSTLVVGPFYLAQALEVRAGTMGLVLAVGPVMAALVAGPAGRWVDRIGTRQTTIGGLGVAATGCLALALLPERSGVIGYVIPVAVMTAGYAVFQTANNTAVMRAAGREQRGLIAGVLNLSRNLGLLTGASFLGGVFAFAAERAASPGPESVGFATRATFAAATAFIVAALALSLRASGVPNLSANTNPAAEPLAPLSPIAPKSS